ncbi:hypothetical protein AU15_09050 [Marinobacter salarius]|uniref:Uncharacterized protein n=1 Tax=Marinobacter salarius TaxID=1420917 RepID=W5YW80_9GAMM|nr:hypothetical protein AU15_09050 [Marinobacter salarius]
MAAYSKRNGHEKFRQPDTKKAALGCLFLTNCTSNFC